mmetsp:Transcript_722/g.1530  ORF Transcript_722/g.1530 Transcript_722/m.1530 type:complete len:85 (-) Transcript_722:448-702(-)
MVFVDDCGLGSPAMQSKEAVEQGSGHTEKLRGDETVFLHGCRPATDPPRSTVVVEENHFEFRTSEKLRTFRGTTIVSGARHGKL